MQVQVLPLAGDEQAMADVAEVRDWRALWGPVATGPAGVRALAARVSAATGWDPWPMNEPIDVALAMWGLVTRRDTTMLVLADTVLPNGTPSGWSAYDVGPDDLAAAGQGLDDHWPRRLELARQHWGDPVFVGRSGDPRIPPGWRETRRHLAVWLRGGAEFHLYADEPTADSPTAAIGVSYSVYASEVA